MSPVDVEDVGVLTVQVLERSLSQRLTQDG